MHTPGSQFILNAKQNVFMGGDGMKGVIFRFNRILSQDFGRQKRAWMLFSLMEFYKDISQLDFDKYVYGQSYQSIMEYMAGRPLSDTEVWELAEKQEEMYRILCREDKAHISLACGAEFLLSELKERKIPRLLVVESKKADFDFYIENFGMNEWFSQESIICEDNFVPGKPNKDIYERAIQAINLPGKNCLVFEDTVSGIHAAKKAGIGKIVVIAPQMDQYIFENMREVEEVIGNFHEFDRILLSDFI